MPYSGNDRRTPGFFLKSVVTTRGNKEIKATVQARCEAKGEGTGSNAAKGQVD